MVLILQDWDPQGTMMVPWHRMQAFFQAQMFIKANEMQFNWRINGHNLHYPLVATKYRNKNVLLPKCNGMVFRSFQAINRHLCSLTNADTNRCQRVTVG